MSRITSTTAARRAGFGLSLLVGVFSQAAFADNWTINMDRSKFGPTGNTLALERHISPRPAAKSVSGNTVVIQNGGIYLARPGAPLELIGTGVHAIGDCGWVCKNSQPNTRLVLGFNSTGAGPHDMGDAVVFNSR